MNKNSIKTGVMLIAALFILNFLTGCSGSGSPGVVDSQESGDYKLYVNWPGKSSGRLITEAAARITVSITGEGLSTPITTSVDRSSSLVTIDGIPSGLKMAEVKAENDDGTVIYGQARDSFIITPGETHVSDSIVLGIAIKDNGSEVVFEPDTLTVDENASLVFYNWTGSQVTVNGAGNQMVLAGAVQDGENRWIYSSETRQITGGLSSVTIAEHPGANLAVSLRNLIITPAAGLYHAFAIDQDGNLWAWGSGSDGMLGLGDSTTKYNPEKVTSGFAASGLAVTDVDGFYFHSAAVDENGDVWTWGNGEYGNLGLGDDSNYNTPQKITAGFETAGTAVTDVAVGEMHTLALDENGDVWGWGDNYYGQLGLGSYYEYEPVKVTAGFEQAGVAVNQISTGYMHSAMLDANGDVWTCGYGGYLGHGDYDDEYNPTKITGGFEAQALDIVEVSCANEHTLAIDQDGDVWTWGLNTYGSLGIGDENERLAPVKITTGFAALGIKITKAAGGYGHSAAIDENGDVWTWGENSHGQLGHGDYTRRLEPVKVTGGFEAEGAAIVKIVCSENSTFALDENGTLWTWGSGSSGILANGGTGRSATPIKITGQFGNL